MALSLVTLTGAADDIAPKRLVDLAANRSFIEIGLLWSPSRAGTGRYPTRAWLEAAVDHLNGAGMRTSIHLCDEGVVNFLRSHTTFEARVARQFGRVQLNFNLVRLRLDLKALDEIIACCERPIITQHHTANALLADQIKASNHHVLHDASGGRGVSPAGWSQPVPGKFNAYAGGLGPFNVGGELQRLEAATRGAAYGIDMEARIRTEDDRFSLLACERVLMTVDHHLALPVVRAEAPELEPQM